MFPIARGSSAGALVNSVIVAGHGLVRLAGPPLLFPWSAASAVAGLVASVLWARLGAPRRDGRLVVDVAAAAKLAFGVALIVFLAQDWGKVGSILVSGLPPFAWLVLLPTPGTRGRLPRLVLAWLAVLEPLQVYPVPGSQQVCGAVPGILCALVCLGDGCTWLFAPAATGRLVRTAMVGIVLAILVVQTRSTVVLWREIHGGGVVLGLPGATRMRVSERDAAATRGL